MNQHTYLQNIVEIIMNTSSDNYKTVQMHNYSASNKSFKKTNT